jgi:hypothetical protein
MVLAGAGTPGWRGCEVLDREARDRIPGPAAVSKAIGWGLVIVLVILLGTHPGTLAGFIEHFFGILERAASELASFLSKL